MADTQHITVTKDNGVSIVQFADRKILEELTIKEIEDELLRIVDAESPIKLLLNFQNVEHLSSAALGTLINLNDKIGKGNGRLILSEINTNIFEVFKITRLNKLFEICDSSEQAMQKF
jgi:anti-sigma B factor antagonist